MSGQDAVTHPVWRIYFPGTPRDHVAIFIQTETAMIGTLIQVRGAIERPSGMRHEKLDNYNLSESRSLRRKERLGTPRKTLVNFGTVPNHCQLQNASLVAMAHCQVRKDVATSGRLTTRRSFPRRAWWWIFKRMFNLWLRNTRNGIEALI